MKWTTLILSCIGMVAAQSVTFKGTDAFKYSGIEGYRDFYVNSPYLAINPIKNQDNPAAADLKTGFAGKSAIYKVTIKARTECDGESKYRVDINGKEGKQVQCPRVKKADESNSVLVCEDAVQINSGDKIRVVAWAQSNKLIPETGAPGGYAWSRGRWIEIVLTADAGVGVEPYRFATGNFSPVFARVSGEALHVDFAGEIPYSFRIIDSRGITVVQPQRIAARALSVPIAGLSAGAYVLDLNYEKEGKAVNKALSIVR